MAVTDGPISFTPFPIWPTVTLSLPHYCLDAVVRTRSLFLVSPRRHPAAPLLFGSAAPAVGFLPRRRCPLKLLGGALSPLFSLIHENQGETLNPSRSMQCGDSSCFRCLIGRWIVGWMVFWGLIDVETVIQL